jgi:hypothetical protein
MEERQPIPILTKPFSFIHSTLTDLGYTVNETESLEKDGTVYETGFVDQLTEDSYLFKLTTQTRDNGHTEINLAEAGFSINDRVPLSVRYAAENKILQLIHCIESDEPASKSMSIEETNSMAPDEAEMKRLGKEMDTMKTNTQVKESGLIPDPAQIE